MSLRLPSLAAASCLAALALASLERPAGADDDKEKPVTLAVAGWELSGIAKVSGGFILADDELVGSALFEPEDALASPGGARVVKLTRPRQESAPFTALPRLLPIQDCEDIASDGDETVLLLGSHEAKAVEGVADAALARRPDREWIVRARWKKKDRELRVDAPEAVTGAAGRGVYTGLVDDLARTEALAPLARGLVTEGLALDGKAGTVFIGLRGPLGEKGRAVVLAVAMEELFSSRAAAPSFRRIDLDLEGGGVRGLSWDEATERLLVVSGPVEDRGKAEHALWCVKPDGAALEKVRSLSGEKKRGAAEGVARLSKKKLLVCFDSEDGSKAELLELRWEGPAKK